MQYAERFAFSHSAACLCCHTVDRDEAGYLARSSRPLARASVDVLSGSSRQSRSSVDLPRQAVRSSLDLQR